MKHFLYPCLIGLSTVAAVTLGYVGSQTNLSHPSRDVANLKSKSQPQLAYKFSSLEETVKHIVKNEYSQVEYSGRFIKEDVDFFKQNRHLERYFIENDREKVLVNPVNIEGLDHLVGKEVILTGWSDPKSEKVHGRIELDQNAASFSRMTANQEMDVRTIRFEKMLVVMGDFNDSLPLPVGPNLVSAANIGDFLNSKTFQEYFKVIYQGRIVNKVTKVVSYRFNRNCADKIIPGNLGSIGYVDGVDLNVMFSELNLNPSDYTIVSVLANCNGDAGWGVASGATVGGVYLSTSNLTMHPIYYKYGSPNDLVPYLPNPDDNWTFLDGFIHERLHTFGHPHANGLDCTGNPLLFPCTHREYQNPFDVMGARYPGYFLNAHLMKKRNVRPDSQYMTITKPGIYSIDNLESLKGNAIIAAYIKIPELTNKVFMVEHRLPENFDRNLIKPIYKNVVRGLILYSSISPWGSAASFNDQDFRIIDPNPQTSAAISNVPFIQRVRYNSLVPEKPFFDPITGVRITVLDNMKQSKNTENRAISFKVDFDVKNRLCFSTKVSDVVDPFFIQRNGLDQRADSVVDLKPGDYFSLRGKFSQFQNSACPAIIFNTVISNTSMITNWYVPRGGPIEFKGQTADAVRPPIGGFEGGYDSGFIGGEDGGGPEEEENPSTPTIEGQFQNSNMIVNVSQNMKVPANAPAGYYELPVTYKNHVNGDGYQSVIKFRINNNVSKKLK